MEIMRTNVGDNNLKVNFFNIINLWLVFKVTLQVVWGFDIMWYLY